MVTIDDIAVIDEESKLSEDSKALMKLHGIEFERIAFLNFKYKTMAHDVDTSSLLETGRVKIAPEKALFQRIEKGDITLEEVQRMYAVQAIGMYEMKHYEKGVVIRGSEQDGDRGLFMPDREITPSYLSMMKSLAGATESMARNVPQNFVQYSSRPAGPT